MYDELKEEEIVRKVGGRFKLSTLIQKRMVQLNQGARPLISTNEQDNMAIVLQEICTTRFTWMQQTRLERLRLIFQKLRHSI